MVHTTANVAAPRRRPSLVLGAALCGLYAFLIAFAVATIFIERYAVNVPFWDEWHRLELFAACRARGLTWHDLFAQYNEHRLVTERLAVLALYHLFGESNLISNMVGSALLLALTVGILGYTLYRTGVSPLIILLLSLLLTSPVRWESILCGADFQRIALLFGFVIALCPVVLDDGLRWRTIALCIVGGVFGTLSMLPGLLIWPVVGAALVVRGWLVPHALRAPGRWRRVGIFAVAALACGLLFLNGFEMKSDANWYRATNVAQFLTTALRALAYPVFDTFPWRPTWKPFTAALAVAQWLCIGGAMVLYLRQRRRPAFRDRLVLFVGLGSFLLANALATGYARGAVGYIPSRYGTLFLLNGVLTLVAAADLLRASRRLPRLASTAALLALSCLVVSFLLMHYDRALHAVASMQTQRLQRATARQAIVNHLRDPTLDPDFTGIAILPPAALRQGVLVRPDLLAELPPDMVPPLTTLPVAVTGDAWRVDGAFEGTVGEAPSEHWGTYRPAGPTATGQMRLGPLTVRKPVLRIPIAGAAGSFGNALRIEDAADPTRWVEYTGPASNAGPTPDSAWTTWWADVSEFVDRDVVIVADDATAEPVGWLAIGRPRPMTRALALFEIALGQAEVVLPAIVLIGLGILLVLAHATARGRGPDLTPSVALVSLVLLGGLALGAAVWLGDRAWGPDQVSWNRGVTRVGEGALDLLDYVPRDALDGRTVWRLPDALSMQPDRTRRLGPFMAGSNMCFVATAAFSSEVTANKGMDGVEFRPAILSDGVVAESRVIVQAPATREIVAPVPMNTPFFVRLTALHHGAPTTDWVLWKRPRLVPCP